MTLLDRRLRRIVLIALVSAGAWQAGGLDAQQLGRPRILASEVEVTLNPSGAAPLTALAEFTTYVPCSVSLRVLGEVEVVKDFPESVTEHSVPILGLYPGQANIVLLTLIRNGQPFWAVPLTITTAPLPAFLPDIVVESARPEAMEPGMNLSTLLLATSGGGQVFYPILFDRTGTIRWYLDLSALAGGGTPFERLKNGNYVFGLRESIYEYDVLGFQRRKISHPQYNFHHEVKELPNGNFVAAVDKSGTTIVNSQGTLPSIEDHMVEIDRASGTVLTEWDFRQILDVDRNEAWNNRGDWFHQNALWYSASDDTFIVSGRHQGLIKVTRDNRLKWILAPHDGWGPAGINGDGPETAPFLLTAADADGNTYVPSVQFGFQALDEFEWTWGQHAPMLLPNGHLFVFDNGWKRTFSDLGPFYSRGVEYEIDEARGTVRQIWEYGRERGFDLYSTIVSDVDLCPLTGNRLIMPGIVQAPGDNYAKIVEVTYPAGELVFEATIHLKAALAPGTTRFDLVYRSRRISLYP